MPDLEPLKIKSTTTVPETGKCLNGIDIALETHIPQLRARVGKFPSFKCKICKPSALPMSLTEARPFLGTQIPRQPLFIIIIIIIIIILYFNILIFHILESVNSKI